MTTALVLSRACPWPFEQATGGIFHRLRMLLGAAAQVADQLEIIFFVPPSSADVDQQARQLQVHLAQSWGVMANIVCVPWQSDDVRGWFKYYVEPVFDVRKQDGFRRLMGAKARQAVHEALARQPDWILAHRLQTWVLLNEMGTGLPPIVLDLDDLEHRTLWQSAMYRPRWPMERLKALQVPALAAAQRRAVAKSAVTLVCSEIDRLRLKRLVKAGRVAVLPNPAVHIPSSVASPVEKKSILAFIGGYTFAPNAQAADELIQKVFPLIREHVPHARLLIVGSHPELIPAHGQVRQEGVDYLGFVRDVSEVYREAAVVCCPIRSGSGTRLKIIEAAVHGVPVVSTPLGAEGLSFESDREILMAEDVFGLAEHCVGLLTLAERRVEIAGRARSKAIQSYGLDSLAGEAGSMFRKSLGFSDGGL